jgi:hypothetical protein
MPIIRVAHEAADLKGAGRAPRVPDEVVGRGLSRSLPDNCIRRATCRSAGMGSAMRRSRSVGITSSP